MENRYSVIAIPIYIPRFPVLKPPHSQSLYMSTAYSLDTTELDLDAHVHARKRSWNIGGPERDALLVSAWNATD